jgi:hypothetical protein
MPIVNIAGKQVHIEEGSESAKVAAQYLSKNPDNAKALFDEAKMNYSTGGVAHYQVPNMHTSEDSGITHHITVIHHDDGTYTLQKRHGY